VVRYDQLGAGKSTRISDTTLMNLKEFVAQLEALRQQLGYDRMYLVGHSWGAQLALAYWQAHPDKVEGLVLASPSLDIPAWNRNVARLVGTLSDSAQHAIVAYEKGGRADPAAYAAAAHEFYGKYVWRHPAAADLDSLIATANEGMGVYMKGSAEFVVGGTLAKYDGTPLLRKVDVPVLFTVGEFDEADPATVRRFASLTKGAKTVVIPGAAHMTTWDAPAATVAAVRAFLRSADSTMAKRRKRYL
jgi:proline iminopeptidase